MIAALALAFALAQAEPHGLVVEASPPIRMVYGPSGRRIAEQLASVAAAAPPLPGLPSDISADTVVIHLAADASAFDSLTGGRAPDWAGGVAMPSLGRIVLPAYPSARGDVSALATTLRHELAHVALVRYVGAPVPRWFDEGYAQLAAGQWDAGEAWQIRIAFALHRAPPLDSLELSWPTTEPRARLAYLLSATAVQYMIDASGEAGLAAFLRMWRRTGDMEPALRGTFGVTAGQFEEDWRGYVQRRFGWAYILSQAVVFWMFVAVLLVLLRWRRRRLDRAKLARLRASEPPDEPAFWDQQTEEAGGMPIDGRAEKASPKNRTPQS